MIPVVAAGDQRVDYEVVAGPTATFADLLASLRWTGPMAVDGRVVGANDALDTDLKAGAVLTTASAASSAGADRWGTEQARFQFQILAGPGAGMTVPLSPGHHVVGSGEEADVRLRTRGVAARHALVDIGGTASLRSRGRRRRLDADNVLVLGETLACIAAAPEAVRSSVIAATPTIPFNRRPRPAAAVTDPAVVLPDPPPPDPTPRRLGWVGLAAPVMFGLVMAIAIDPRMALFALLGPVVMVGSRIDDRRHRRRSRRITTRRLDTEAAALAATLRRRRHDELRRRRVAYPSVAMLAWWVTSRSPRLWERRRGDPDFLRLVVGYGTSRWRPPLVGDPAAVGGPVATVVAAGGELGLAPVTIDLSPGVVLGVAGDRSTALDLVRGLACQAAVLHGPSDLRVAVITDRPVDWDWAEWLPHTVVGVGDGRRLLAGGSNEAVAVLERIGLGLGAEDHRPLVMMLIDRGSLSDPSGIGLRRLLSGRGVAVAGVVVAATEDDLPAECTGVAVMARNRGRITMPGVTADVEVAGAVASVATDLARSLARLSDPDLVEAGSDLPGSVRLLDLVGLPEPDAAKLVAGWGAADDRPEAVIGVTDSGPLRIDLGADGPHALLAGTTGSGKSELLRTLVASLALRHDPGRLTLVLIDYKGGSAFDAAARLPHTVGLVTDLDEGLAGRALRCLEAELRHRERQLRMLGAADIDAYHRLGGRLARMVIVVDEFAALVRELPSFVAALVDIAARGRSLGVNLVLATQRPAGVIGDGIRANTNVRIALRVTDRADSMDVLGDPGAAAIARRLPGRGLVRLGPGEIVSFQAALVSTSAAAMGRAQVEVRPFRFAHEAEPGGGDAGSSNAGGTTDLDLIVSAATEAVARIGLDPPRRPWPEPLPWHVGTDDIVPSDDDPPGSVAIGLVDEPDKQRIVPFAWSPDSGSLGMYGVTGCGLTTAIHTIVLGLASGARRIQLYLIDGGGGLAPLSRLSRVGAVVSPLEGERMARLVRMLLGVVDARQARGGTIIAGDGDTAGDGEGGNQVVVVIDGLEAVLRAAGDATETMVRQGLIRVIAEGNGAGIVTVFGTPRPAGLPAPVEASVANRLVFRQADPVGAAVHRIRGADSLPPGRAIHASTARTVQVAVPGSSLVAAAAAAGDGERPTPPVGTLPDVVSAAEIEHLLTVGARWTIPVGIGDTTLAPVVITLTGGEHVLVAGGARSGRTTMLAAVASVVCRRAPQVRVVAVARAASPLGAVEGVEAVTGAGQLAELVDGLVGGSDMALILVDDTDELPAGDLTRLVGLRRCGLHVVAAVRPEVKSVYDHWARAMAVHRLGVWLRPSAGVDADLWRTPLPRRLPARVPPGRGLLIADGVTELIQVMRP